jgi:hypothetical protein
MTRLAGSVTAGEGQARAAGAWAVLDGRAAQRGMHAALGLARHEAWLMRDD